MCTIGALVIIDPSDQLCVYGFKNADNPPVGYWHGVAGSEDGYSSLAFGLLPQTGINSGMNEKGLLLISSFFGYSVPGEKEKKEGFWRGDLRGKVQAEVLARCATAEEALALMQERFDAAEEISIGGSHVIVDRRGGLYVFEHSQGYTAWQDATAQGWAARSNQSFGLFRAEQELQSADVSRDRQLRLERAESVLSGLGGKKLDASEAIANIEYLLRMHENEDGSALGSVCAHGVRSGRSNAPLPHDTVSGMIWDLAEAEMRYTLGQPCCNEWKRLRLGGEG
ncbi:carcinine hydrolase/isopenicillin-N N-acyltransferase family protein [Cohnella fermenti]|uniref:Peptidase C45 hydrolase domain-containing protein n=1 Tax=Cohnella fermenti TaxID=2565925 RepID=A0A4S4C2P6_9BACL|nr:carcinine hydrolase/isopenicillin-N N-acyltransferase family protein [Cohnella fermenti]THF81319.1 hypothetical protein E6C55_09425 [Cohnella fermenti]